MRLFFKFGWVLVFLSINFDCDLFHPSNRLILHDVFVFFTTSYICLVTHVTKIITLQLHKVHILPNSYMYKLLIIHMYLYVYTYILNMYLLTYFITKYPYVYHLPTYILRTYLFTYLPMQLFTRYLDTCTPTYPLTT